MELAQPRSIPRSSYPLSLNITFRRSYPELSLFSAWKCSKLLPYPTGPSACESMRTTRWEASVWSKALASRIPKKKKRQPALRVGPLSHGGREGGREGGSEGGRERGREGGREGEGERGAAAAADVDRISMSVIRDTYLSGGPQCMRILNTLQWIRWCVCVYMCVAKWKGKTIINHMRHFKARIMPNGLWCNRVKTNYIYDNIWHVYIHESACFLHCLVQVFCQSTCMYTLQFNTIYIHQVHVLHFCLTNVTSARQANRLLSIVDILKNCTGPGVLQPSHGNAQSHRLNGSDSP